MAARTGNSHQDSAHQWMQEARMTPMRIIVAATRIGARSCDMEKDLGALEAGKLANILVVEGDPLKDLNALTKVDLVMRAGKIVV